MQLLAALITGNAPEPRPVVRLGDVIEAFVKESPMFLTTTSTRKRMRKPAWPFCGR
jgi:hypothetical protein